MQVCMMLLLADLKVYLYGVRILRYLVFAWCIFFNLSYIAMAGGLINNIFVNGWYLEKQDFTVFDLYTSVVGSYMAI